MRSSPSETRGQFRGSYTFHDSEELAFMNRTGSGVVSLWILGSAGCGKDVVNRQGHHIVHAQSEAN